MKSKYNEAIVIALIFIIASCSPEYRRRADTDTAREQAAFLRDHLDTSFLLLQEGVV